MGGVVLRTGFLKVSPIETSTPGIKLKLTNLGDTRGPTVAAQSLEDKMKSAVTRRADALTS